MVEKLNDNLSRIIILLIIGLPLIFYIGSLENRNSDLNNLNNQIQKINEQNTNFRLETGTTLRIEVINNKEYEIVNRCVEYKKTGLATCLKWEEQACKVFGTDLNKGDCKEWLNP